MDPVEAREPPARSVTAGDLHGGLEDRGQLEAVAAEALRHERPDDAGFLEVLDRLWRNCAVLLAERRALADDRDQFSRTFDQLFG